MLFIMWTSLENKRLLAPWGLFQQSQKISNEAMFKRPNYKKKINLDNHLIPHTAQTWLRVYFHNPHRLTQHSPSWTEATQLLQDYEELENHPQQDAWPSRGERREMCYGGLKIVALRKQGFALQTNIIISILATLLWSPVSTRHFLCSVPWATLLHLHLREELLD